MMPDGKLDQNLIDLQINETLKIIDIIKSKVCYVDIVGVSHYISNDGKEVVCQLTFSRGTSDYEIGFNWLGFIDGYSKNIPKMLLSDFHNAVIAHDLAGIIKSEKKNIRS